MAAHDKSCPRQLSCLLLVEEHVFWRSALHHMFGVPEVAADPVLLGKPASQQVGRAAMPPSAAGALAPAADGGERSTALDISAARLSRSGIGLCGIDKLG
jgi:hypothetical protein